MNPVVQNMEGTVNTVSSAYPSHSEVNLLLCSQWAKSFLSSPPCAFSVTMMDVVTLRTNLFLIDLEFFSHNALETRYVKS